jgi:hypothetical protein
LVSRLTISEGAIPTELAHAPAELSLRERRLGLRPGYNKARYHVRGIHHDIVKKKATDAATIIKTPSTRQFLT